MGLENKDVQLDDRDSIKEGLDMEEYQLSENTKFMQELYKSAVDKLGKMEDKFGELVENDEYNDYDGDVDVINPRTEFEQLASEFMQELQEIQEIRSEMGIAGRINSEISNVLYRLNPMNALGEKIDHAISGGEKGSDNYMAFNKVVQQMLDAQERELQNLE
ncbi:hypothetical protein [Candidatus Vampirococcus lugosii]|uniref:Uncharacterized protein n=1 Tax=Candidatus Vampirococcus lugosii TaxID=2789015 RepID=A0ABS5QLK1_9BACT|nr:hypothetical protein [Candidatus Vampirococcus lugosii]MBS8121854.1 hypothetical protein [Candidatus Vampirococcus lugosii]